MTDQTKTFYELSAYCHEKNRNIDFLLKENAELREKAEKVILTNYAAQEIIHHLSGEIERLRIIEQAYESFKKAL